MPSSFQEGPHKPNFSHFRYYRKWEIGKQGGLMKEQDELAVKVAKEIVIKFIEVGRISPTNFQENFRQILKTVREALKEKD
jgi:hypothetical protein